MSCTRRKFVSGLTLAGMAGLLGNRPDTARAEPLPETTTLRIADGRPGICIAPQYVAADLLRGEGFTDVQYLLKATFAERLQALTTGEAHMAVTFVSSLISRVDAGDPIVVLAGSHVGCFELFARNASGRSEISRARRWRSRRSGRPTTSFSL